MLAVPDSEIGRQGLVIVGNGMAGARLAEEVLRRDRHRFAITVFGDEPRGSYNRVALSQILGGFADLQSVLSYPVAWYEENGVTLQAGFRVVAIDREQRKVVAQDALARETREARYDRLVIATGSRPFVPPLEGMGRRGVHVFRTLDDCEAIAQSAKSAKRAVVLGGGLLGLEAARGLLSLGVAVTVVEVGPHLMAQQLDRAGAELLAQRLVALGLEIRVGCRARALVGDERVAGVALDDGGVLAADMVVVSCGIRPNVEEARAAGLAVNRAIVVDDQLRSSDPAVFALGECAEHRGALFGLVEPIYDQTRVLADVLTGNDPAARYLGSRPVTVLKVVGVDVASMGGVGEARGDAVVLAHADPERGTYRKVVLREGRLAGAVSIGEPDALPRLRRLYRDGDAVEDPFDLLKSVRDDPAFVDVAALADSALVCNCHLVPKGRIVECIAAGARSIAAIGEKIRAGTGCGSCQALLGQLLGSLGVADQAVNKVELLKKEKHPLDAMPDIERAAASGRWQDVGEDDAARMKWHGLFPRKQTPGQFMLRLRAVAGQMTAAQWRVIADLADEHGTGFCDLTTRQQVQLRGFAIDDTPEIWRRLAEVGLGSQQTGMDNVRGVCGCPAAGVTPGELLDATPVARRFTELVLGDRELANLPRKLNVTITGCLDNCCHPETQDIGLVPAVREVDGGTVAGFNLLCGGKQGSGGYRAATSLDLFLEPGEAAEACLHLVRVYREHGPRALRNRARFAFLVDDRGAAWLRRELERRLGRRLPGAGADQRHKTHVDHVGIYRQKSIGGQRALNYVGLHVPVGRITGAQMRGVADLAARYGSGDIRVTTGQNLVLPNVADAGLAALTEERLLRELSYNPSPIVRGLVSCTGIDYCSLALIETKGWAMKVARGIEQQLGDDLGKIAPITIRWSGCPAGCGLHQAGTVGLLGRRIKVDGEMVDAAHVFVGGKPGPDARPASELLHDVPCESLVDALVPIVRHYRRDRPSRG